jgi:hypothetical protein
VSEPFVFGIPLIGRAAASDWALVDRLLQLTLHSVLAQTDQDFMVVLAGHDRPPAWEQLVASDPRFAFIRADWDPEPPSAANDDGGRKKFLIKQRVREAGGGLLMFLDADDWVDRDLVRAARAGMTQQDLGALIVNGTAVDCPSRKAVPFPVSDAFPFAFHQLCGSSTVARIDVSSDDPARRDPHAALGSHHEWEERAQRQGWRLARLEIQGAYLVGTNHSHSESHGPFADWRRSFAEAVRTRGEPLREDMLRRFGVPAGLF